MGKWDCLKYIYILNTVVRTTSLPHLCNMDSSIRAEDFQFPSFLADLNAALANSTLLDKLTLLANPLQKQAQRAHRKADPRPRAPSTLAVI